MKRTLLTVTALAVLAAAAPVRAEDDVQILPPEQNTQPPVEQTQADLNGQVQYQNQYQNQYQPQPQQQWQQPQQAYQRPPAPQAFEYLELERANGDLGKYSKKKYQAVTYTVKNVQPVHVELIQAEVPAAIDEATVAKKKSNGAAWGLKAAGMGLGIASSFVPYAGGMGAYYASSALGQAGNVASGMASATANASGNMEISGQYVQKVSNVVLSPNQTFTFTSLLPKEAQPTLKLIFKNLETNQIYDLTK